MNKKLVSIGLAAISLLFFCNFTAQAQDEDALKKGIELYTQATADYQANKFDLAIQNGSEALKIANSLGEEGTELKKNASDLIPKLYYGKAANLFAAKDYESAEKAFNEASVMADQFNAADVKNDVKKALPQLYMALGKEGYDSGDFDNALIYLEKAAIYDTTNSNLYMLEGAIYFKKNDIDNTEKAFEKCISASKIDNNESNAKNAANQLSTINVMKADAARKANKWADAYKFAEKSLGYAESNNGYLLKGTSALQLKKWDAAIEAYTSLANADDKMKSTAYYQIGTAYQSKGNKAKACEYFKKLLTDPQYKAHAEQKVKLELKCQ